MGKAADRQVAGTSSYLSQNAQSAPALRLLKLRALFRAYFLRMFLLHISEFRTPTFLLANAASSK